MNERYLDPPDETDAALDYVESMLDAENDYSTIRAGFLAQFANEFSADEIDGIFDDYYNQAIEYRSAVRKENDAARAAAEAREDNPDEPEPFDFFQWDYDR